jgi:hypothetical protein
VAVCKCGNMDCLGAVLVVLRKEHHPQNDHEEIGGGCVYRSQNSFRRMSPSRIRAIDR